MINRNNYEEYLMLYLDGELSSADREAVELFLKENPDLQEELEILQQAVLIPEAEIQFANKASLYRKAEGINLSNYQEYFLLYIDNELNSSEKESVETFVLQQPHLQDEFTLLKQTILPAENIVFTDKQLLYRKEEKRRPVVISIRWASLAAAVMIGIIALVMFSNDGKGPASATGPVAGTKGSSTTTTTIVTGGASADKTTEPQQNIAITGKDNINSSVSLPVNNSSGNKRIVQPLNEQQQHITVPQEMIANNYGNQTQDQQVAVTAQDPVTSNVNTNTVAAAGSGEVVDGEQKSFANNATNSTNNIYQQAVYTENVDAEKDKTVYLGSMQVNPDKVRGFFRKAGRFLSSKVKSENDNGKVKVANVELNKIK